MQYATKKFLNKKKLFGVAHTTGRGGKRKPYKGLLVTKLTNLRFSASYKISLSSTNSELSVNNGTSKRCSTFKYWFTVSALGEIPKPLRKFPSSFSTIPNRWLKNIFPEGNVAVNNALHPLISMDHLIFCFIALDLDFFRNLKYTGTCFLKHRHIKYTIALKNAVSMNQIPLINTLTHDFCGLQQQSFIVMKTIINVRPETIQPKAVVAAW